VLYGCAFSTLSISRPSYESSLPTTYGNAAPSDPSSNEIHIASAATETPTQTPSETPSSTPTETLPLSPTQTPSETTTQSPTETLAQTPTETFVDAKEDLLDDGTAPRRGGSNAAVIGAVVAVLFFVVATIIGFLFTEE
jgi:hypothetical protein